MQWNMLTQTDILKVSFRIGLFALAIYFMVIAIQSSALYDQANSLQVSEETSLKQILNEKGKVVPSTIQTIIPFYPDKVGASIGSLSDKVGAKNNSFVLFLQENLETLKSLHDYLRQQPDQFKAKIDSERSSILQQFDIKYHDLHGKAAVGAYLETLSKDLDNWIDRWVELTDRCSTSLEGTIRSLTALIDDTQDKIEANLGLPVWHTGITPLELSMQTTKESCNIDLALLKEPIDQPKASDNGLPGLDWVLNRESGDFILLIGVIGFGMFGALISPFIRRNRGSTGTPRQFFRDLSAAIVVYLVSVGGLAIFSQGAAPKPYAIFVACLVAAVFSEDVWKWIREREAKDRKKT